MNYNPGISYRGDQWIMEGGRQMQQGMTQLLQYLLQRGSQAKQLRAQVETLVGPESYPDGAASGGNSNAGAPPGSEGDNGGMGGQGSGGFNPVMPAGGGGGEESGPSAAAQRGSQAEALRRLIKSYAPEAKDLHQAVKGMSVDQLEGMLKGYGMRQAGMEQTAKMADYQAQAELRKQQALDDQTVGRLIKAYGTYEPEDGETAAPGERLRAAFKSVPEAGGRVLPKAIEALTRYEQLVNPKGDDQALTTQFSEDPVSHVRFATRGKILQPSGVNPEFAQPALMPQHDDDGNLVGWSQTDVKGHSQFTPFKGGAKFPQITDQDGNPVPGQYLNPNTGKSLDVRSKNGLAELFQAAKAPTGPLPLPKKAEELVKGKQYQTAKGVATWDGAKFVK